MRIAYFDCYSGAGGDMIVGALISAGAPVDALRKSFAALGLSGYTLSVETVHPHGLSATRVHVELDSSARQPHRHLRDITEMLEASSLPDSVKKRAQSIFQRLAEAEARVHGTTVEGVHFHEVGAVDAVIDVVGTVVALDLLRVDGVICSPIPTGSGTVTCAHGVMPVPAPATAELLRGVPIAATEEVGELTTPTGAAVLTTLARAYGPMPSITLESVGYGAGTRPGVTLPNTLRVFVGEMAEATSTGPGSSDVDVDEVVCLETNLDDASPEVVAYCMEQLLEAGALDAYTVPIHMKKSRSGVLLAVLCPLKLVADMERIVFRETATFGIRRHTARRSILRRRMETVATPYGDIRLKVALGESMQTASPEFEDCRSAARRHGVGVRQVMAAARQVWAERAER